MASEANRLSVIIQAIDLLAHDMAERADEDCAEDLESLGRLRARLVVELEAATGFGQS